MPSRADPLSCRRRARALRGWRRARRGSCRFRSRCRGPAQRRRVRSWRGRGSSRPRRTTRSRRAGCGRAGALGSRAARRARGRFRSGTHGRARARPRSYMRLTRSSSSVVSSWRVIGVHAAFSLSLESFHSGQPSSRRRAGRPGAVQSPDRLVRVGAEGAAAVRHHLRVGGELREAPLQLVRAGPSERPRCGPAANSSAGLTSTSTTSPFGQPLEQLGAPDAHRPRSPR